MLVQVVVAEVRKSVAVRVRRVDGWIRYGCWSLEVAIGNRILRGLAVWEEMYVLMMCMLHMMQHDAEKMER